MWKKIVTILVLVAFETVSTAFGATYVGLPKGVIHQAYVDYNDSDTINIAAGYGECNGHYWEITSTLSHDMNSLASGEDYHYIYIDDVNSLYPTPTFYDSTVEPAWSDLQLGWYNGNDRCIGVVWSPAGSATIMKFHTNSDLKYITDGEIKRVVDNGNPTGSGIIVEATAYTPVNAIAAYVEAWNSDTDYCYVAAYSADNPWSYLRATSYSGTAYAVGWLQFKRGDSRDLMWNGEDNDDDYFKLRIEGFQIER